MLCRELSVNIYLCPDQGTTYTKSSVPVRSVHAVWQNGLYHLVYTLDHLQAVRVRNQLRLQRAVGQLMRSPGVLPVLTAWVGISHCDTPVDS